MTATFPLESKGFDPLEIRLAFLSPNHILSVHTDGWADLYHRGPDGWRCTVAPTPDAPLIDAGQLGDGTGWTVAGGKLWRWLNEGWVKMTIPDALQPGWLQRSLNALRLTSAPGLRGATSVGDQMLLWSSTQLYSAVWNGETLTNTKLLPLPSGGHIQRAVQNKEFIAIVRSSTYKAGVTLLVLEHGVEVLQEPIPDAPKEAVFDIKLEVPAGIKRFGVRCAFPETSMYQNHPSDSGPLTSRSKPEARGPVGDHSMSSTNYGIQSVSKKATGDLFSAYLPWKTERWKRANPLPSALAIGATGRLALTYANRGLIVVQPSSGEVEQCGFAGEPAQLTPPHVLRTWDTCCGLDVSGEHPRLLLADGVIIEVNLDSGLETAVTQTPPVLNCHTLSRLCRWQDGWRLGEINPFFWRPGWSEWSVTSPAEGIITAWCNDGLYGFANGKRSTGDRAAELFVRDPVEGGLLHVCSLDHPIARARTTYPVWGGDHMLLREFNGTFWKLSLEDGAVTALHPAESTFLNAGAKVLVTQRSQEAIDATTGERLSKAPGEFTHMQRWWYEPKGDHWFQSSFEHQRVFRADGTSLGWVGSTHGLEQGGMVSPSEQNVLIWGRGQVVRLCRFLPD